MQKEKEKYHSFSNFSGEANAELGHEKRTKLIDTLEYISTKSRMLAEIKDTASDLTKMSVKRATLCTSITLVSRC